MSSALSIGTTGLAAASKMLDVVGNNLANTNTLGFKSGNIYFASMLNQSLTSGGGSSQTGQGVQIQAVDTDFAQGSFETTASNTDLAIDGEGFFIVNDTSGTQLYTRSGAFHIDKDGYLVDTKGYTVQGHMITGGIEAATLTDLQLGGLSSNPTASTTVSIGANLNADAAVGGTYETAMTVYDSLGASHTLTETYTKTAANAWTAVSSLSGSATTTTTTFTFGATGALATVNGGAVADVALTPFVLTNGANALSITWDLAGTTSNSYKLTQYAGGSTTNSLYTNGNPTGSLKSLSVASTGIISGFFTNGLTQDVARIVLAGFPCAQGLAKVGNYFAESYASGQMVPNNPEAGGLGSLQSATLETSNTDTATEFMNMIAAQRAYQANAKVITTADAMLAELMAIK